MNSARCEELVGEFELRLDAEWDNKLESGRTIGEALSERYQSEPMEKLLVRFLYCCDNDVVFATETLLKDMEWREALDIESLVKKSPEQILGCNPADVHTKFLSKFHGLDRAGRPVLYYLARTLDTKGMLQYTTADKYLLYQAWVREVQIRRIAEENPQSNAPYFTSVMDCSGVRLAQANRSFYSIIKGISEMDQWHFPGMIQKMVITHAPFFFTIVWKVIRKFLSAQVESKISIVGCGKNEINNALAALVPEDNVPSDFYGAGPAVDWTVLDQTYLQPYRPKPKEPPQSLQQEEREDSDEATDGDDSVEEKAERSLPHLTVKVDALRPEERKDSPPMLKNYSTKSEDTVDGSMGEVASIEGLNDEDIARLLEKGKNDGGEPQDGDDELGVCIPPHIAILVYDKSDPPRLGLRSDLLQTIEAVLSEKDSFERYALNERKRLRGRLRNLQAKLRRNAFKMASVKHSPTQKYVLKDPANLQLVKSGLYVRAATLQDEIVAAREECRGYSRAVKFARNYLEQEAMKRESRRKALEKELAELEEENKLLKEAVNSAASAK